MNNFNKEVKVLDANYNVEIHIKADFTDNLLVDFTDESYKMLKNTT